MGLTNFIRMRPPLVPGEKITWQRTALYCLPNTTIGGTFYATSSEFIFMPNRMSSRKDWGPQRIPFGQVANLSVQERTGTPYNGGLRRRVRIDMRNSETHLVVMRHPDDAVDELRALLGRGGPN